jgi:hypothetical protein
MGVGKTVYKGEVETGVIAWFLSPIDQKLHRSPVGASLLAMDLRTPLGVRLPASSLTPIASRLAPTGKGTVAKLTQIDGF